MKKVLIGIFADYLTTGHRAGDYDFKIREAPWNFTMLLTIQLCALELLISLLLGVFNPEYVLFLFLLNMLVSFTLNYSFRGVFLEVYNDLKQNKTLGKEKFYKNKFVLTLILSLLLCFSLFYYAMKPNMIE